MKKFTFWKDNKVDGEYKLTPEEFMSKFSAWLFTKEVSWLEYYGTSGALVHFIADRQGLCSVYEPEQYSAIEMIVGASLWDHVDRIKKLKPLLAKQFKDNETKFGFWKLPYKIAIEEGHDISHLTKEFLDQYETNPKAMEEIVGKEAAEILWSLTLPVYEKRK